MSDSIDDIRRRMQQVRQTAACEVKEIVDSAKTLTDWRYHIKRHPWVCMGAAAALGYLVVPRKKHVRSEEAKELAALLKKYNVGVSAPAESSNKGMMKTMIGAAVPMLARTAVKVAQQRMAGGGLSGLLGAKPPETADEGVYDECDSPRYY
ncbi:MAG: hypothetical protein DCC67_00580 [Planctomycetota bacterium]|nr:MAG: hypothetical protein DCC67_00580 [Planctomycetota bacterium]